MQTMYESEKIGIIGGDMRQIALARRLGDAGFECATFGLPDREDIGRAVRCRDWQSSVEKSMAVILPVPVSRDGLHVNMPFADDPLSMTDLVNSLSADTVLIGGKFDLSIKNAVAARGIRIFDYNDNEEFQIKNAVPTAEGAIEIAMRELPITLHNSSIMILGYGRIGKLLFSMLQSFCKDICIAARKKSDLAYAESFGGRSAAFGSAKFVHEIRNSDVIFNTVPADVLTENMLGKLKKDCIIIDLASGKGGTDFGFAEKHKIKAVHALALPGKVAPVTAGNIIGDLVLTYLAEERGETKN